MNYLSFCLMPCILGSVIERERRFSDISVFAQLKHHTTELFKSHSTSVNCRASIVLNAKCHQYFTRRAVYLKTFKPLQPSN